MTREEVIKGLETCEMSGTREDCEGYGCPYFIYNDEVSDDCQMQLFGDTLALLKAQESMRARLGIIHFDDGSKSNFLHCPFDGATLDEGDNYCRRCGRAVVWDA